MTSSKSKIIAGWLPDFSQRCFFFGQIEIQDGSINGIIRQSANQVLAVNLPAGEDLILPGLVDAHIHIESTMLTPARFAEAAIRYGTIATVSDPHEIANVCGIDGLKYMIRQSETVPFKTFYTIPSCVPATDFETTGATIGVEEIETLVQEKGFVALGEMMNYPGVIFEDQVVLKKIEIAKKANLPIDGHAPGVSGDQLVKYIGAGISTDHECFTFNEALEKLALGMKILIREGSAAKNFEALWPLIESHTKEVMLCTDDLHPDDLIVHHMDKLVRRGLKKGISIFDLLLVCSINPILHYDLPVGRLQVGDPADFIIVSDLHGFTVKETWIDGECQYNNGKAIFQVEAHEGINRFVATTVKEAEIKIAGETAVYRVIGAIDGELITENLEVLIESTGSEITQQVDQDILKIVIVNRYHPASPVVGLIKGFGLRSGAMASSIAHDCHQVIAVGATDHELVCAINKVIMEEGGIAVSEGNSTLMLPLKVAGLMSNSPAKEVAEAYRSLSEKVKSLGSPLQAPFMTLSFMGLLVIPSLKMSDLGLFDSKLFQFVPLKV